LNVCGVPVEFEDSSLVETSGNVDDLDLVGCYDVCSSKRLLPNG